MQAVTIQRVKGKKNEPHILGLLCLMWISGTKIHDLSIVVRAYFIFSRNGFPAIENLDPTKSKTCLVCALARAGKNTRKR